ncbi:MAG: putative ABC transporter permease [Clostridia bacterium]|nr:putative ABC transporter permease [Clostridia bacterium]
MIKQQKKREGWHLILVGILISHIGWVFEKLLFLFLYNEIADRGFVTLPLCPIYGITIVILYKLIGTPHSGGILLSRLDTGGARAISYFFLAAIIPSVSEIIGGTVMEALSGEVLWSYEHYALNVTKYAALEIAYIWGAIITLVMCFFDKLCDLFSGIKDGIGKRLALSLSALIAFDFFGNVILRLK